MANFDSKDTASFRGVWVFCEQREGQLVSTSHQLPAKVASWLTT